MTRDSRLYCDANTKQNLLLLRKPIPDGTDFTAETMVILDPQQDFQGACLLAYQDDDNFVATSRGFCDPAYGCVGDGVYFDQEADGCCFCIPGFRTAVPLFDAAGSVGVEVPVWLRITREGSAYSACYSLNGRDWNVIGTHTAPNLKNVRIGITTSNSATGNLGPVADFDYLSVIER
jgi:regulation of enolase protein 1 (concanavalin A-like superfamily)